MAIIIQQFTVSWQWRVARLPKGSSISRAPNEISHTSSRAQCARDYKLRLRAYVIARRWWDGIQSYVIGRPIIIIGPKHWLSCQLKLVNLFESGTQIWSPSRPYRPRHDVRIYDFYVFPYFFIITVSLSNSGVIKSRSLLITLARICPIRANIFLVKPKQDFI